ncbi:unnamed protein product [Didymodactylos carnosus]|uniref:Chitin-binding type-3 domain-containing protein n=1 Tax=Didymodactylos carnosus TaxID=1234261 RepID=A0A813THI7_9BILA|nr:unnamed protein product [Didymodactylos carnosus]CAF3600636.1 unnamed protein product [Didymodactylos carnosus]
MSTRNYGNINYMAIFYNINKNPSTNNGVQNSGKEWLLLSPCNGTREIPAPCATAWNNSATYSIGGTLVSFNNRNYESTNYSQGFSPAAGYVISYSMAQPWQYIEPCY